MNTLSVEAQGSAAASPDVVWSLVAHAPGYAEWGAWDGSGDGNLAGKASGDAGTTRWMRLRNTTTVEEVLEVDAGRRMVYTVLGGIPVHNYRAEVTLTPTEAGTDIRWTAVWDRTLLGRIVQRKLRTFYPQMVSHLVAAAERTALRQIFALVATSPASRTHFGHDGEDQSHRRHIGITSASASAGCRER